MESVVKRSPKRNCFESSGRIDNLPEEVITKILVHLSIRDAVGTSRLSRSWRFRWMSMPELIFDSRSTIEGQTPDQWIDFINNVLLLRGGDVTKVKFKNLSQSACPYVDRWLVLLQWRKKLQDLCISFDSATPYRCPSTLFYSQDLTTLVLERCELQLPPQTQFNGFINLTILHLHNVRVNKETIEFLVNNSIHLQELNLLPIGTISHLSISAPNLRKCRMSVSCERITFIKTPKLQFVFITNWLNGGFARCKLGEILGELVQIQDCRIFHPFVDFLSFNNFWQRVPIIYYHLNTVVLGMDFEDSQQILAALWLFRSSPLLKTICIFVSRMKHQIPNGDLHMEEFYEALDKRETLLQSLEIVEFLDFEGSKNELRFIQFLLLHANVLRTMQIKWKGNNPVGLTREGAALFKLLMLQRTSSRMKFHLRGWEHNKYLNVGSI